MTREEIIKKIQVIAGVTDTFTHRIALLLEQEIKKAKREVANEFQVVLNDNWEIERTRTDEIIGDRKIVDAEKIHDKVIEYLKD